MDRRLLLASFGCSLVVAACGSAGTATRASAATVATMTFFHQGFDAGPILFTNAAGHVVEERRYEPFGVPIGTPDLVARDLNPLNKRTDPATGWSDHGARWYAPDVARWLTPDPPVSAPDPRFMDAPWALHPYQYVSQNPISFWDPDGRENCRIEFELATRAAVERARAAHIQAIADVGGAQPGITWAPSHVTDPGKVLAVVDWNNRLDQTGAWEMSPILGFSMNKLAAEARSASALYAKSLGFDVYQDRLGRWELRNTEDGHNNVVDGFRHAFFSYRLAQIAGVDVAKRWTDAHEVSVPGPIGETAQDVWNNAVGRQLFLDHPQGDPSTIIKDAINRGQVAPQPFGAGGAGKQDTPIGDHGYDINMKNLY